VRYNDPLKNELEFSGYQKIDAEKRNLIANSMTGNNNYETPPKIQEVTLSRKASAPPPQVLRER
jgi:hypothetical protein